MLTVKEVCKQYHIGKTTLYRWTRDGLLPYSYEVRLNKNVLVISEDDIIKFLKFRLGPSKLEDLVVLEKDATPTTGSSNLSEQLTEVKKTLRRMHIILCDIKKQLRTY